MFGQCFSIASAEIYSDAPHYYRGNGFVLGAMVIGAVTAFLLRWYLGRENRKRERDRASDEAMRSRMMDIEEIGEAHPDFVYYL